MAESVSIVKQLHAAKAYSKNLLASGLLAPDVEWWAAGPRTIAMGRHRCLCRRAPHRSLNRAQSSSSPSSLSGSANAMMASPTLPDRGPRC